MTPGFHKKAIRRKAISWTLILAFVTLLLFPHHYHIHHGDDAVTHGTGLHGHVTAIHAQSDIHDLGHHDDGHTIASTTDISLKNPGFQPPWVIILMAFALLLPLVAQASRPRPSPGLHRIPRYRRHSTPPLRAPPRT